MLSYAKLKEQAVPLLVLSVFQIALNFNFPAFTELGFVSLWAFTFILIFLYMVIFSHAQYFRPLFDMDWIEVGPPILKDIMRGMWVFMVNSVFLYVWHVDMYHMSSLMYKIWFVHYWLVIGLLYRAAYKE